MKPENEKQGCSSVPNRKWMTCNINLQRTSMPESFSYEVATGKVFDKYKNHIGFASIKTISAKLNNQ